jgi:hypothetical protein
MERGVMIADHLSDRYEMKTISKDSNIQVDDG